MIKLFSGVLFLLLVCLSTFTGNADKGDQCMQSNYIRIDLDEYGQIITLENLLTERQYLSGIPCGFKMVVNVSTNDIWASKHGKEVTLSSADVPATLHRDGDIMTIEQKFSLENGIICVVRTLKLASDAKLCVLNLRIVNECENSVITKIDWLSIKGLVDTDNTLQLLWPDKEGEIYSSFFASGKHVSASYPSLMSMQYVALSNEQESLYYGVHDTSRQFKDFDVNAKYGTLKSTHYPFVASGQTIDLPCVVLGIVSGDWHSAANVYRDYLVENNFTKTYGSMASTFSGVASYNLCSYPQKYNLKYVANAAKQGGMVTASQENLKTYGTSLTIFMGWHEKGFDSMYPDYAFIGDYGGEEAFAQGIKQVHEVGGKALIYINLHIADTKSNWYNTVSNNGLTNGENCAIRTAYNSVLHESYGTGLDYVAMCPMSQAWQDAIVAAVERTRNNGADGYWFDQLMEMPGNLCYNEEHGHTTPAAAYAEGYDSLFTRINEITTGSDCIYSCEGTCDAYLSYIDICGLMWARLFGNTMQAAPQITRYTLPVLFFGLPTYGAVSGTQKQYSWAWVMGNGMLCRDNNPLCKRYATLVEKYPEIYTTGRYMDTCGLASIPEGIMAGILCSREDNKWWAVQLFNNHSNQATFSLKLNTNAVVRKVYNAENNQVLIATENGWEVEISANRALSLMIEFE